MKTINSMSVQNICNISVCEIEKQDAIEILKSNIRNRKINKINVEKLSKSMNDGRWIFNGDTIVIDGKGRLVSGQHRLIAFVQSSLDLITVIFVRLKREEDVLLSLNRGKSLTCGQYLQIKGFKNANRIAAIVRLLIAINESRTTEEMTNMYASGKIQDYEIEKMLNENPIITEIFTLSGENPLPAPFTSVLAYAAINVPDKADWIRSVVKKSASYDTPSGTVEHQIVRIRSSHSSSGGIEVLKNISCKTMNLVSNYLKKGVVLEKVYPMPLEEFKKIISRL